MRSISVKAVVVGGITDIIATNAAAFPVLIYVAATRNLSHLPRAQQTALMLSTIKGSPSLYLVQVVLGSACSVLGGYVAARIGKRREVLHGLLAAFLCEALGVYAMVSGTSSLPAWQHVFFFLLSPALGALGGYLRLLQARAAGPDVPPSLAGA